MDTPWKHQGAVVRTIAFILAAASAYAFSFALDLLLGGFLHVYPSSAFLPVVTWSVAAGLTGLVAVWLVPTGRFLVIPCLVFATLALLGGIVGHRYNLAVAVGMIAQAFMTWMGTRPTQRSTIARIQ